MIINDTNRKCEKCDLIIPWDKIPWSISEVKGYKTKVYNCECGGQKTTIIPTSEEKLNFWNRIFYGD